MISICTGGKAITVLLVLPCISASASIAFRWAVGFAFYAMEHHHDPRTEAVGARRCRLGHMLRRFQPLFCGRRHAQPFLCVGERAGGRARGYRGRHAAQKASPSTPRRALAADSSYQLPLLQEMRCTWLAPAAKTGFAALSHGAFFLRRCPLHLKEGAGGWALIWRDRHRPRLGLPLGSAQKREKGRQKRICVASLPT